jgi:hypothetical protein
MFILAFIGKIVICSNPIVCLQVAFSGIIITRPGIVSDPGIKFSLKFWEHCQAYVGKTAGGTPRSLEAEQKGNGPEVGDIPSLLVGNY